MALDKRWLKDRINNVLRKYNVWSVQAQELLMMTAAVESNLGTYLTQDGGPALSIFQIEPKTYEDIWNRVLNVRWPGEFPKNSMSLILNFDVSIMACRAKYLSIPEPLPNDVPGLAKYWKKYYNTPLGKGKVEDAVKKYKLYC